MQRIAFVWFARFAWFSWFSWFVPFTNNHCSFFEKFLSSLLLFKKQFLPTSPSLTSVLFFCIMDIDRVRISKFLSKVLRHKAEDFGIELDEGMDPMSSASLSLSLNPHPFFI